MKNKLILHIPHSRLRLPSGFASKTIIDGTELETFVYDICDMYTDKLFTCPGCKRVVSKYSRVFCDVEKFDSDRLEIMARHGMGFVYSKTHYGKIFMNVGSEYKEKIRKTYYKPYHERFNAICDAAISRLGEGEKLIIVDCHSFSDELVLTTDRRDFPDICIGFNDVCSNEYLVKFTKKHFENAGYSNDLNFPYSGSMLPSNHLEGHEKILSIMIEIHKRTYMDVKKYKKSAGYVKLKRTIKSYLKTLQKIKFS